MQIFGFDGPHAEHGQHRLNNGVCRLKLDDCPRVTLPEILEEVRQLRTVQVRLVEVIQVLDFLNKTVLSIRAGNFNKLERLPLTKDDKQCHGP